MKWPRRQDAEPPPRMLQVHVRPREASVELSHSTIRARIGAVAEVRRRRRIRNLVVGRSSLLVRHPEPLAVTALDSSYSGIGVVRSCELA